MFRFIDWYTKQLQQEDDDDDDKRWKKVQMEFMLKTLLYEWQDIRRQSILNDTILQYTEGICILKYL